MTVTAFEPPPASPESRPRFPGTRRRLRNLSVGTVSLLVLASAGLYLVSSPPQAFALSAPAEAATLSGAALPEGIRVVYGKVTDRFNRPLEATVEVRLRNKARTLVGSATTELDGTYRIELPGPGKYRLTVSAGGVVGRRNFTLKKVVALQINAVRLRKARFNVGPISSY